MLPSTYVVTFGGVEWGKIDVAAGEVKILNPAVIAVKGVESKGHQVFAADGTLVAKITTTASPLPVPPGKYTIEIAGEKQPLDLKEGQTMEIDLK